MVKTILLSIIIGAIPVFFVALMLSSAYHRIVELRRRVALKVIKLGMDTREVIARFEAERQALAMMDHPNIAKVHRAQTAMP